MVRRSKCYGSCYGNLSHQAKSAIIENIRERRTKTIVLLTTGLTDYQVNEKEIFQAQIIHVVTKASMYPKPLLRVAFTLNIYEQTCSGAYGSQYSPFFTPVVDKGQGPQK